MRWLDRFIQRRRIAMAARWIPAGARVVDIGCHRGELFDALGARLAFGIGLDPLAEEGARGARFELRRGLFPERLRADEQFDVATFLAVLEHMPEEGLRQAVEGCRKHLRQGGRIVVTVPSPAVDPILQLLLWLRLIDGMSLEEHHGFDATRVRQLFESSGFALRQFRRFQFGLNNIYVFEST